MTTPNITPSDQLVPVFLSQIGTESVQVCDARALHAYLESKWQFADWIKIRIEKYGFEENQDFACLSVITETQRKTGQVGVAKRTDYHLTLDMAKELAMVENNQRGREVRRYFIKMEKLALATANTPAFANLATVVRAWADTARSQANIAQSLAEECERHLALVQAQQQTPILPIPQFIEQPPTPIPNRPQHAATRFLTALWDCLGSRNITAGDLYRIITSRQCPALTDAAIALFGELENWNAKKLVVSLRTWSEQPVPGYALAAVNRSKQGILWHLERLS